MSTDNYISLRQSEYNRLMRSANRVDNMEWEIYNRVYGQMNALNSDMQGRINSLVNGVNRSSQNLSSQIRQLDQRHTNALRRQAEAFSKQVGQLAREVRQQFGEVYDTIDRTASALSHEIGEARQQLQSQIDDISSHFQNAREAASTWVTYLGSFLDEIVSSMRPEKFFPGRMTDLKQRYDTALANLNSGLSESALSNAQMTFMDAVRFRDELFAKEVEWQAYLSAARKAGAEKYAECIAQQGCTFNIPTAEGDIQLGGENVEQWTGGAQNNLIDYWTEGGLYNVTRDVKEICDELQSDEVNGMAIEDFKERIRALEDNMEIVQGLAERAKEKTVASQLTFTTADDVVGTLLEQGWEIADSTYEGDDFRGRYCVKLKDGMGDEIVAVISPEGRENAGLNLLYFDPNCNNDDVRQRRTAEILENLQRGGVECGKPVCKPGTRNLSSSRNMEWNDIEAVRKARPGELKI